MRKFRISGVPICDDQKRVIGIITNRDMRFLVDFNVKISEVMTKDHLVTAPVGTNLAQAQEILRKHKIEKLPIVDENNVLRGLITIKDIEKSVKYPNAAKDSNGRLLAGAAIGAAFTAVSAAAIAAGKEALGDKLTGTIVKEIYVPGRIINIVVK